MPCKFFSYNIYIYTKYIIYIYYTLESAKNIDTDINKLDEITDDNATNEINYDGLI